MKEFFELSNPQKNIFMREEFYNGTSINNISFAFYIKKDLDSSLCVKALNKIVEKNEGIRLRIKDGEDGPIQYVEDFSFENFTVKEYKSKTIDDIKKEIRTDSQIPFIFKNNKLYKFVVYKCNGETIIYVKVHHIIGDAWIVKIFFRQFNEYYTALSNKSVNPSKGQKAKSIDNILSDNHPSYLKFVEKEKDYFSSPKFESDKKFWENYINDLPEAIPFKEIYSKKTCKSKRFKKEIPLSTEIKDFCSRNKVSPFDFFITAYSIYLYKAQSKTDFTIGTPLLNRKNFVDKDTFGMFVSTAPLKIHIENDQSIKDFIKNVSLSLMGIMRHESYPYNAIMEYIHSKYSSTTNLFDTIISFQNIEPDSENIDCDFYGEWFEPGNQQSSMEMHITNYKGDGNYTVALDYNVDLCDDYEISLIFDRLINIMRQMLNDVNQPMKNISLITNEEKELISDKFNFSDDFVPDVPLIELFNKQVEKHPNNAALKFNDYELTYKELDDRVNIFANKLLEKGIKGNIPVCILVERSLDMVISMLATLRVGAYYVTIDPYWPRDRVEYIIENIKSNFLITHHKYENDYDNFTKICVEDIDYNSNVTPVHFDTKMSDFAYVIYTSGSTGRPKGTMMTNINIGNLLNSTYKNFHQNDTDIWTLFHTYTFDFSAWEIYGCLTNGGKLIIVPRETTLNPAKMVDLIIKERVTILNQTPAYFYKLLDEEKALNKTFTDLRLVILGGEAVFAEPVKYWKQKYPNITLYNGYGPTETTIFAVMGEITDKDVNSNEIVIGKPLYNYEISIVNKFGEPLGIGLEGELCITSKSVCSGYFNNAKMTNEKFIKTKNGMTYKSGDVGYWQKDGRIKYIGRNDHQVKIRGFRVELEEIEKELLNCEKVSKAVVFPVENSNLTKSLVAFIETDEPNYTDTVLKQISKNLTSYMIPKLYQVSSFPVTDHGKVDTRKLLADVKEKQSDRKIVPPSNALEREIYDLICEEKNTKDISINDNFFTDIGLDSLDIMKLATSLTKYNVEIQKINNNPSIKKLADSISNKKLDIQYIDELYNIDVVDKKFKFNIANVFLTGATGFLGVHLLKTLIDNKEVKKVYCLVRHNEKSTSFNRMRNTLKNYYKNFNDKWFNKIEVIDGDFSKEFLGMSKDDYYSLCSVITTIVHCGANVKHYGKYEDFYQTNVVGTENMIKLAYDSKAKLAHISTLSVGGFSDINSSKVLTEKDISIDQKFNNNVYMITKYEAECKVLDAISKGWILAKIFRMGNIMPRYSDGCFQKNKYDNAFLSRMQTILNLKICPDIYLNMHIDLTPVDDASRAVVKLLKYNSSRTIHHIFNKYIVNIFNILDKSNFKVVSTDEAIKVIGKSNNPYDAHMLNDLLNPNVQETPATSIMTETDLRKAHFRWHRINKKYVKSIYNVLNKNK